MTTEQYSIGYDAGYQDGFDAVLAEPVKQEPVAWHEPGSYGNVTTHKIWAMKNGWLPLYPKEQE